MTNLVMHLRDHPLMSSNGVPIWPPEWIWADGLRNVYLRPKGEVGILQSVQRSLSRPGSSLLIRMSYERSIYLGRLDIDNPKFCRKIFEFLTLNIGHAIEEIGKMEIPRFW